MREAQTRNLEIPGSMLTHRPGMTAGQSYSITLVLIPASGTKHASYFPKIR
jgi:outer membrane usher protein FimD/PapC